VPQELADPEEAEELGAVWEGEELVTYGLDSLRHQVEHLEDDYMEDVD
jgi:aryl carrier-like protein